MNEYQPSPVALESLSSKILVMIVGPTSIGKSTLMQKICELDSEFSYVQAFTTRPRRSDAPSTYRHISEIEAAALYSSNQAITYIPHPTTGYIYGTDHASYKSTYNLLDTLAHTVELYRSLPFQRTYTISLTADVADWQRWLAMRFPAPSEELTKRLVEAKTSIEWSLAQTDNHAWVVNSETHLESVAQQIIEFVRGSGKLATETPPQAKELLAYAENLLS